MGPPAPWLQVIETLFSVPITASVEDIKQDAIIMHTLKLELFIAQKFDKFNMCTKSGKKVIVFKITSMECLYQVKQGQVKQKQLEDGDTDSRQAHGCISSMDYTTKYIVWWARKPH